MNNQTKYKVIGKMAISFTLMILISLFFSCSKGDYSEAYAADLSFGSEAPKAMMRSEFKPSPQPLSESVEQTTVDASVEKKIIKDGQMGLKVESIDETKAFIDKLLSQYNGYYGNENLSNSTYETTMDLVIRIPEIYFEKLIKEIEVGGSEIEYKNLNARDVTDQFIDLESRLENKRAYLLRYREILAKANTVEDILQIQNEIRQIEEEIDSTEGRLKYLRDQVSLSTLNLRLTMEREFEYEAPQRDRFSERVKESVSQGWYAFVTFIVVLFKMWPLLILIGGGFFLVRRKVMKKRGANQTQAERSDSMA